MHCRRVRSAIFLFADGQLAGDLRVAFRSHVETCPHCLRELEAAERLLALLRRRCRREQAPEQLRTRVVALIASAPRRPMEEEDA